MLTNVDNCSLFSSNNMNSGILLINRLLFLVSYIEALEYTPVYQDSKLLLVIEYNSYGYTLLDFGDGSI